MLSHRTHKVIALPMALALIGAPVVLAGCDNGGQDVPTAEDMDNAAREEQGAQTTSGSGGDAVAPATQGDTEGQEGEGTPATQGETTTAVQTSADGSYSTTDFVSGSSIYGRSTAAKTNDFQFVVDGIGTWEMVALKDDMGYVYAGDEINPTTLRMGENKLGTISVNGQDSQFGWQQYKDFPQLAMGDIGKRMTLTMELNDAGMLTVRQDADGQVMLFRKVGGQETVTDMAAQQEQQPADQPIEQPQTEGIPMTAFGDEP